MKGRRRGSPSQLAGSPSRCSGRAGTREPSEGGRVSPGRKRECSLFRQTQPLRTKGEGPGAKAETGDSGGGGCRAAELQSRGAPVPLPPTPRQGPRRAGAGRTHVPEVDGGGIMAAFKGREGAVRPQTQAHDRRTAARPGYLRLQQAAGPGLWGQAQVSQGGHVTAQERPHQCPPRPHQLRRRGPFVGGDCHLTRTCDNPDPLAVFSSLHLGHRRHGPTAVSPGSTVALRARWPTAAQTYPCLSRSRAGAACWRA